jgi:hypothetical protein
VVVFKFAQVVFLFNSRSSLNSAKFLTEDERREVKARLRQDRTALADEYHIKYLFAALKDWKIYVHMLITIGKSSVLFLVQAVLTFYRLKGIYTPLYSISLFLPTIVKGMSTNYTNNQSQLMTVPPYVVGCFATITAGYYADKAKKRGPSMIFFCLIAITGFIFLISTHNAHVQYAGTFFVVAGYVLA